MVSIGQFGHYRTDCVSNADWDKTNLVRRLIERLEARHDSHSSCDHFLVCDPSTWSQELEDLHRLGNSLDHSSEI